MKKFNFIYLSLFIFICLLFSSCQQNADDSNNEENTPYKVEAGIISNSTYTSAYNQLTSIASPSYAAISSIRTYCMNNTISDYTVQKGVTIKEMKDFLIQHQLTEYEADRELSFLKSNGNTIAFFFHATDSTKKIWMYATK